jgi:RNA polymerase sigma-70 factor (ECF subfamily)
MVSIHNDSEIVRLVKSGDIEAFSELIKRHQKPLLRTAVRYMKDLTLAEDVVQESFIKAFENIDRFEERSSFKSWIFQITINTAKNRLRGKVRHFDSIDQVDLAVAPTIERDMMSVDFEAVVRDEVEKLPPKQKTALRLRVYEDLSFQEIAEIMNCPYDTAKANYRHGLMKLKKVLSDPQFASEWLSNLGDDVCGTLGIHTKKWMEVEG